MNKEGIMEDNRKGTWEDVTNYCGTRSSVDGGTFYVCYPGKGYVRALLSKHGISGHCVEGGVAGDSPNAKGYRLVRPTADTWAVEHFIPDPEEEWVDVTMECAPYMYRAYDGSESNVEVRHDGNIVATLGGDEPYVPGKDDYRVTFARDGVLMSGSIKVEKRND